MCIACLKRTYTVGLISCAMGCWSGKGREKEKDMNSRCVVVSLETDVEWGGVQIQHGMICSSQSCQLLLRSLALLKMAHP